MREYKFDYTISDENNTIIINEFCNRFEDYMPTAEKEDLLVDVDGSSIQVYTFDNKEVVVYDDYDIGAVFVKSDISLSDILVQDEIAIYHAKKTGIITFKKGRSR